MNREPDQNRRKAPRVGLVRRLLYWVFWAMAWLLYKLYFRIRVHARPPVPDGPLVVAANHSSYLDPPLLGVSMTRRVVFMVTQPVYEHPLMRPLLWCLGCIPVAEDGGNREAVRDALDELRQGNVVGIFPEGGISDDGRLLEGQSGVASLILQGRAKVMPAALVGPFQSLPRGGRFPRPVRLEVHYAPVLDGAELAEGLRGAAARAKVRDRVMAEIARRLPESQRPLMAAEPLAEEGAA